MTDHSDDDPDLRAAFRHLREQEQAAAPSASRVLARARSAGGEKPAAFPWPARFAAAALLLAGLAGIASLLPSRGGSLASELPTLLAAEPGDRGLFADIDPLTSDSLLPFYLTIDLF